MHATVLAILLAAPAALLADDHLVGQKVMVVHWDSKLTDNDKKLTTPVYLGDVFTVEKVDGRLLWVKCGWLHDTDVLPVDEAVAFFSAKVEADPKKPSVYLDRASAYTSIGEFERANTDLNKYIDLFATAPDWARANSFGVRGFLKLFKRDFDGAIEDCNQALKLHPKYPYSYGTRGLAYRCLGKYELAISDFNKQIELDPKMAHVYGNRAWIWATCPDSSLRDPDKALESATHACELCDWHSGSEFDTLAAAYAAKGDFASAVKWQTKAVEMGLESHSIKRPEDLKTRLELYKSGKPFIDTPVK